MGVPAGERAHEQSAFPNHRAPWGQDAQVGMGSRVEMGTEGEGGGRLAGASGILMPVGIGGASRGRGGA